VSTDYEKDPCEVCVDHQAATIPSDLDGVHQNCPRCGEFKLSRTVSTIIRRGLGTDKRARLSGWVREQNRVGSIPTITTANLDKILARPIPSVAERATALLIEAEQGLINLGDRFNITDPRFLAATYSSNKQDVFLLLNILRDQGLAEGKAVGGECEILPRGYMQLDEMKKHTSNSSQGFVAMWFHNDLERIYSNGFEVGILTAGYDPIRVDRVEHISKIDDEIIRQINASKFVVADFTGHRGGVYFEAGYALGLGLPVFWTCSKDDMRELHFDIRQFNCIDWTTPEELANRLSVRLEAVLGPGPKK
jgi:hypothetical protein